MKDLMTTPLKRFDHLTKEIDAAYHEAARRLGLSDSALMILYTICTFGSSCLLSDINRLSGVSKQTINSALRRLEADGVVFLETFDGKKKRVCLTEKGMDLADHTAVRLIGIENDIFSSWPKKEREMYLELTQKYLDHFREKIKDLR